MRITRIEEFLLSDQQQKEIHQLLRQCFSEYPTDQSYYKQLPSFRLLAQPATDDTLIGHLALEHRLIERNGKVSRIFGVGDLCVSPEYQSKNVASSLLQHLETLARQAKIDFIVLISNEHEFYKKNGFQLVNNTCRWLIINNHQTIGVAQRRLENCLMVKALGTQKWEAETVDFLGHMF